MRAQPFNTVQDYDTWSRRSLGIPELFDQAIDNMRQGMKAGVVQPRDLMESAAQLDAVIKPTAEESIFWSPIRTMPNTIPAEDKARISAEYKRMIELRIMPAYRACAASSPPNTCRPHAPAAAWAHCPMARPGTPT